METEDTKTKTKNKERLTFNEMQSKMNPQTRESTKTATGLGIKGINYPQKQRFLELSKEMFRGDWGHTLSYLVNYFDDTQIILTTLERVTHLENRLNKLLQPEQAAPTTKEKPNIKLLNNREIPRK